MAVPSGSSHDDQLDRIFRALGDRTRRNMLSRLATGPAIVTELARPFDMSLQAAGKHLRVLERAGLVRRDVQGRLHRCSLRADGLEDAGQWLDHYRRFWEQTLDGLAEHVKRQSGAD